jgi:hypothetical protein
MAPALAASLAEPDEGARLERLARAVCDVLGAVSCVAATPQRSAGAARLSEPGADRGEAHVVVGHDAGAALSLTVTLPQAPSDGVTELLDLLATTAASRVGEVAPAAV